jgi:hypothetical protein
MVAYYRLSKIPKEKTKREYTQEYGQCFDAFCNTILSEESAQSMASRNYSLNVQDFSDVHSLVATMVFCETLRENVDFYRIKKIVEFTKTFEELRVIPDTDAIEICISYGLRYMDKTKFMAAANAAANNDDVKLDQDGLKENLKGLFKK